MCHPIPLSIYHPHTSHIIQVFDAHISGCGHVISYGSQATAADSSLLLALSPQSSGSAMHQILTAGHRLLLRTHQNKQHASSAFPDHTHVSNNTLHGTPSCCEPLRFCPLRSSNAHASELMPVSQTEAPIRVMAPCFVLL